ncbi:MAG: redoxin domain-containing protein [Planctomycetaceae bacterium]|nr:redoxin domain-containing protein [Planctomycetaceae bacterium]
MSDASPLVPSEKSTTDKETPPPRDWGVRTFLGFLFVVTCLYATVLFYHMSNPVDQVSANDGSILEQCRQLCLKYGLVSTGHVRNDAEAYLQAAQINKLTAGLSVILADSEFRPQPGQSLPLIQSPAPDFQLADDQKAIQQLTKLGKDRPMVVVFYLGYGCSHCVAQLLALDKDRHYFQELDADIVAISSDSTEHTAEKYKEYGRFGFPVLADPDYAVSTEWGVYTPATDEKDEFMLHGTFIVDRTGKVIWGEMGREPFLDNKTLLHVIAKSQGLLPVPTSTSSTGTQAHASSDAVRN